MKIEAKIILDSIIDNIRVTTFELTLPKFILAELNTHRVFSRSTASSRAIPNKKIMKYVSFTPDSWRKNIKGMQPKENIKTINAILAGITWKMARFFAKSFSNILSLLGVHKELCNRLVEPFMYCKTVLTATNFDNFFELRCHNDAQYEIRKLAIAMRDLYETNKPKKRELHLPFLLDNEVNDKKLLLIDKMMISTARCARVSYVGHDGKNSLEDDKKLFNRLLVSEPLHASPAEHIAMSPKFYQKNKAIFNKPERQIKNLCGNFSFGIVQFRKIIEK